MLRSHRTLWLAFALATTGIAIGTAHADVIEPEVAACGKAGDACEVNGKSGACVDDTCTRMVYGGTPTAKDDSPMDGGGSTPHSESYACARCVIGAEPSGNGKTKTKSGCSVDGDATPWASMAFGLLLLGAVSRRREP